MKKLGIAAFALVVGGFIYICWRSDTLLMFTWFDLIGVSKPVETLRNISSGYSYFLPKWFLFSLPNALWLFSGLVAFEAIWGTKFVLGKIFWFSALLIIAIGSELGQALGLIQGTFDWYDILLLTLAGLGFTFFSMKKNMLLRRAL